MALPANARWGAAPPPPCASPFNVSEQSQNDSSLSSHAEGSRKRVVLDSGAIILGGRIERLGDEFWTVQGVLAEIRDPNARLALTTLPFELQIREVDPEALAFVTRFSKLTGDFTRLSATDLKVKSIRKDDDQSDICVRDKESDQSAHAECDEQSAHVCSDIDAAAIRESADNQSELPDPPLSGDAECRQPSEDDAAQEDDIDPDEFERLPIHNLNIDDEGWVQTKSHRPREGSEASWSSTTKGSVRALPPGWYEGEEDDKGWITPDNCSEVMPAGCDKRPAQDAGRVACATTDFAMQNVLLQIGLRVLNMDGLVVKQVKQFVLKCHACFKLCLDSTKLFCPCCGNAALMRVSMYVQEDGTVTYSKGIKNFSLRGTKYSLPLPKQGRGKDDLVLREDQLLLSKHRQQRRRVVDEDGFQTLAPSRARRPNDLAPQEIIGMGFSGGGKSNPNARRRPAR